MGRYKQWLTTGLALSIIGVLAGCATTSNRTSSVTNGTNRISTTNIFSSSNSTQNQTLGTDSTTPTSNSTIQDKNQTLTLENIQYESNAFTLIMTHGDMKSTYEDPHFTTGVSPEFVVTLHNSNPGKYPLNKVQTVNTDWAKSLVITKSGNNLVITFDLKKSFQSFKTGIAGGFEIQFSFK